MAYLKVSPLRVRWGPASAAIELFDDDAEGCGCGCDAVIR